jgi:DNA-binding winged helix-turn-helix (wHTH) protein
MAFQTGVLPAEEQFALGPFRVDLATTRLLRDGVDQELRPRAFRALHVLIQNPGRLVDYEQLIRDAWDGTRVSTHTINVTVGEIKTALREYGFWIACRPKLGYCLEIPESDDLIRTGQHFRNQFTRAGFEHGLRCFHQAVQNDGADFRALEAISSTYLMLGAFLLGEPRQLYCSFLEAHNRAVALRGLTPELRLERGYAYYVFEGNLTRAEEELLEVKRHRPKSPEVYARLAMVKLARGQADLAASLMAEMRTTDLLLPPLAFVDTIVQLFRRQYPLALERGKEALDLHPGSQFGRISYAEALEHAGRLEEAATQYHLAATLADAPWMRAVGARFLAKIGRRDEALEALAELNRVRQTEYIDAYQIALLLDALGERDEAFRELDRAFEERSWLLLLIDGDPKADALRKDPRFEWLRFRVAARALFASPDQAA